MATHGADERILVTYHGLEAMQGSARSASLVPNHTACPGGESLGLRRAYNAASRGCLEQAVDIAARACSADPSDSYARFHYGLLLAKTGAHNAAISQLRAAVDSAPDSAVFLMGLGLTLLDARHTAEAETALAHAISLRRDYDFCHTLLACTSIQRGDVVQGIELFQNNRGHATLASRARMLIECEIIAQQRPNLMPDFPDEILYRELYGRETLFSWLLNRASAPFVISARQLSSAIQALIEPLAVKKAPQWRALRDVRTFRARKEHDHEISALQRYLELKPTDVALRDRLIDLLYEVGRYEECGALLREQNLPLEEMPVGMNLMLSRVFYRSGDYERASQILAQIPQDPLDFYLHYLRGVLAIRLGRRHEAIGAFELVLGGLLPELLDIRLRQLREAVG